jgi:hypothetical protein
MTVASGAAFATTTSLAYTAMHGMLFPDRSHRQPTFAPVEVMCWVAAEGYGRKRDAGGIT